MSEEQLLHLLCAMLATPVLIDEHDSPWNFAFLTVEIAVRSNVRILKKI